MRSLVLHAAMASACALSVARPRLSPTLSVRCHSSHMSLFLPERAPTADELKNAKRMEMVAARYDLDLEKDFSKIEALAASSLPEEENGNWLDLAACSLRNACTVALLLSAVGALPGQASAYDIASLPTSVLADAESDGVVAIIAVPLLVGGLLVAALAVGYPMLIKQIQGDDRR